MGDVVGQLKVTVLQGKRVAVRNLASCAPYVAIKLGNQTAKTKVIWSCLNPVWNEELTCSIIEPVGILRLEVFDQDRFGEDETLGHAFLNLQPLALETKGGFGAQASVKEMKIRKIVPASDNCLVGDSFISCVNREIVQHVCLRLCDVESGQLELKIKWIDLPRTRRT
ncbi:protein C2-DOMAIN ABA-RELATED 11-like [Tasmannia lanceolata]|uniref:protein C2-DOMAIN ABA-RELATED 11-like n=1 Tax=Tasmannia lanceolata TaxID=3420 RepID=UPI0040649F24